MNPALLATQQMNMQNLLMQGQANLGQAAVLQIVQDLKTRVGHVSCSNLGYVMFIFKIRIPVSKLW